MQGFKDISNYSKSINYIFPTNEIRLEDINNFFSENNLTADKNILSAFKSFYGNKLDKSTLQKKDITLQFEDKKITDFIKNNYKTSNNTTNIESIYHTLNKFDFTISKEDINSFITSKGLTSIDLFSDYIINILPK